MRIVPDREMASASCLSTFDEIAVRQQDRGFRFVRLDAGRVDGHDVGSVRKIGNAAKSFGFTLRAVSAVRTVETGQLRIGRRVDIRLYLKLEWPIRRLVNCEALRSRNKLVGR